MASDHPSGYSQAMPLARKIILHAPLSDEALFRGFVEQCLKDGVSLVAVVGPDCTRVEDIIDGIVVGDGRDETRFLCTSSHPGEALEDVLDLVMTWESEQDAPLEEIWL